MRAWGKDLLVGFGVAELIAVIAYLAGAGAAAQAVCLLIVWPLAAVGLHRVRRGSDPTLLRP